MSNSFKVHQGNALHVLPTLSPQSIDCAVTSPPYYKLRNYDAIGQIGIEKTPEEYISNLVKVFDQVRRVLKDNGTLWINIADTYLNKNLIGIPWMLAFALKNNHWFLRQDIIWNKPNCLPSSVVDRCTTSHEYIFLLSKSKQYFFDANAISEPAIYAGDDRGSRTDNRRDQPGYNSMSGVTKDRRNKRSVWSINTFPFSSAHFATFPPTLPQFCIKAGCPKNGIVLDPFSGAATTGIAAIANERNYVGIELNPEYVKISNDRYQDTVGGNFEPLSFSDDDESSSLEF